jgi:hypothetical protein
VLYLRRGFGTQDKIYRLDLGTYSGRYAMSIIPAESERFSQMEKVAELTMYGRSATSISKELDIPRKTVLTLQEDYRTALANDTDARDMARDYLHQMAKHYDKLIEKFYDLIDDIDILSFNHQVAAQKNAALKAIAELDAKRLDAYQKAGLLDSAELGDELAEMEEKQSILIDILRSDLCPDCQKAIAYKLSQVTGKAETIDEPVVVEGEWSG